MTITPETGDHIGDEPVASRSGLGFSILTELLHSYRRPALVTTEHGAIACINAAALRSLEQTPDSSPTSWPRRATILADGAIFYLAVPSHAVDGVLADSPEMELPPRLAKIVRLVISGCTDKQIAARTGLAFATVRTYVRQIYRRMGTHNRVELVHVMNGGPAGE